MYTTGQIKLTVIMTMMMMMMMMNIFMRDDHFSYKKNCYENGSCVNLKSYSLQCRCFSWASAE